MAKSLSELGHRRRRAPKVDAHLLGAAVSEYLKFRLVMERNLSEPLTECLVCDGLMSLQRPAGPVTIDGCLKMMSFLLKFMDVRPEYFAVNGLFLDENRKARWASFLEDLRITKRHNEADENDANLHCARGVGSKDTRLASFGLEEAICSHCKVLLISDMTENEHYATSALFTLDVLAPGGHRTLIKDVACLYTKYRDRVVQELREEADRMPLDKEEEKEALRQIASQLASVAVQHNLMHIRGR